MNFDLCHSDLHVMAGKIPFPLPAVLGHEVSGTIVEMGEGTRHSGLTEGDQGRGRTSSGCTPNRRAHTRPGSSRSSG